MATGKAASRARSSARRSGSTSTPTAPSQSKSTPRVSAIYTPIEGPNAGMRTRLMSDGTKQRQGGGGSEPTTLTDTNIRENVIPDINERIDKMTNTGQYTDTAGNKRNPDGSIVDDTNDDIKDLESDAKGYSDDITSLLKGLMTNTDQDTARELKAINKQYDVRKKQLEDINQRTQQSQNTALMMGGSSRYTTSADDISATQARFGILELAELDAQEQAAIAKVKSAQTAQKFKVAQEYLTQLETLRQEKIDKATKLQETLAEENKQIRERNQKLADQEAVATVVASGERDPIKIFQQLGGKVPFDTIKEAIDLIPEVKNEQYTLGRYDIRYDAEGNVIARGMGAGGGVAEGSVGDVGLSGFGGATGLQLAQDKAWAELDYAGQVASITRTMFGGNASDADREIVEKAVLTGRKLGLSRQQVLDNILGFNPKKNQALGEELKNVIMSLATITGKGLNEFNILGISDMLNNDRTGQAIQAVENAVYREAKISNPDDYIGETNVRNATQLVNELSTYMDQLRAVPTGFGVFDGEDLEDLPIGVTEGTMQEWMGRFRKEEATAIKTRITEIVAKMRNDLLGSAVTAGESTFLDPIIPQIYDTPAAFLDKLERLKTTPLVRLNNLRATYGLPQITEAQLGTVRDRVPTYQNEADKSLTMKYQNMSQDELLFGANPQATEDPNGIKWD